jgi:transcriptional regulator GlxA family with amidase domain
MVSDMNVAILVLDQVFDSGLAMLCDTLETANQLAGASPPFKISRIGVRRSVHTAQGLQVPVLEPPARRPDLVLMPALGCKTPETIDASLERRDVADACALLGRWHAAGSQVAGACTATFVLAAAGILEGKPATTTWWLAPCFRARFPGVALDESQMVVSSAGVVTAGAALAHVDLALWLVRRQSPTLARVVARHLVYDHRASQAAYVMPDHVAHADEVVERFEQWARKHLAGFSMSAAARAAGTSERTLERRLRRVLGRSPLSYVQDLRVEHALHQLETTEASLDDVASAVGYSDAVTLRTLIRKKTGQGIRELRARR